MRRCEFLLPLKEAQRVDILPMCLVKVTRKKFLRQVTSKARKAIFAQKQTWPNIIGGMMVYGIRLCEEKRILLVK